MLGCGLAVAGAVDVLADGVPAGSVGEGAGESEAAGVGVSVDGVPISVKVREGSGYEALDEAALNAVWHWKFTPARRGGEAVEASFVVPIRFQLDRDEAG